MKKLNEVEKAYLACALDSEGTISLFKRKRKYGGMKRFRDHFCPRVKIGNSNDEFISYLHSLVGGYIYRNISNKKRNPNWKIVKVIVIARWKEISILLEQVLPYMIIKKRQAELLIEACKLHIPNFGKCVPYSTRMYEIQEEVFRLNRRG